MSLIVLKVTPSLHRWAVLHNGSPVATFGDRQEAERAALAIACHHPRRDTAEVELHREDGGLS
jgi:hypothetical protein